MNIEPENSIGNYSPQQYEDFEPDNISLEEELFTDRQLDNGVLTERLDNPNTSIYSSTSVPFCALCLRKCPSDVVVRFSSRTQRDHIGVSDGRRKLKQVLDLTVLLNDRSIVCRACWKLVDIFGDFRESCLKSVSLIERFSRDMQKEAESDRWFSRNLFSSLQTVHKSILDNRSRIDMEAVVVSDLPEIKVTRKDQKAMVKTEIEIEDEIFDDLTVSDSESPKSVNLVEVLLENDNHKPSILTCEKCGRKFDGAIAHRMHVGRCVNEMGKAKFHTCSICNATFKEPCALRFHMNKHNGVRPFKCRKFCDRTFSSNFVRIKHERFICEVDKRVCPTCGAQLKNEFSLTKHIEAVHGEAKYSCAKCPKTFRTSRLLWKHQTVHSDERKYSCAVCEKSYKSMYAVKVHMRTHTQEKPYACHLCDLAFKYKASMKTHIERHHGQSQFAF